MLVFPRGGSYNYEHVFVMSFRYGLLSFRYGLRGRELLQTVSKASIQGGGTFGCFMAIGSGIRC